MVNATFAKLYLLSLILGMHHFCPLFKFGIIYSPVFSFLRHICKEQICANPFFRPGMYSAIPPNIDSIKRALSPLHSIQYCCFLSTGPGCGALLTRDIVNRTIQTTTAFNSSVDENYAILNSSSAWCSSDLDTFQYLTINIGTGNLARPTCVSIFWGV